MSLRHRIELLSVGQLSESDKFREKEKSENLLREKKLMELRQDACALAWNWNYTFVPFAAREVKKKIAQSTTNDCEKEKSNQRQSYIVNCLKWNVFTVRAKTIIRFSFHSESKHESESSVRSVRIVKRSKVVRIEIESWRDASSDVSVPGSVTFDTRSVLGKRVKDSRLRRNLSYFSGVDQLHVTCLIKTVHNEVIHRSIWWEFLIKDLEGQPWRHSKLVPRQASLKPPVSIASVQSPLESRSIKGDNFFSDVALISR